MFFRHSGFRMTGPMMALPLRFRWMGGAAPSVAKANIYDGLIMYGLKPVPFKSDRCQTKVRLLLLASKA